MGWPPVSCVHSGRTQSTELQACRARHFPVFDCTNAIFIFHRLFCSSHESFPPMKKLLHSHDAASKGAALIIVLAFVVLVTALALTHFSRSTTDRQLAQSSSNDTSADLLARSGLDVVVSNFKQEIGNAGSVTQSNIQ